MLERRKKEIFRSNLVETVCAKDALGFPWRQHSGTNVQNTATNNILRHQPFQLARAMVVAKVWRGVQPLSAEERRQSTENSTLPSPDDELLVQIKGQTAAK